MLEEVPIPGERFIFDFWVPSQHLVIECQGRQHGEFVPFFHGTRAEFNKHRSRDAKKVEFCRINDLVLVLAYPGDEERLGQLIDEARAT